MAYIKVDINKLGQLESQLNRIPSVISSTASTVRSVRSGLDWDVACEAGIDSTLRRIASDLEACKSRMQNTVRFVDSAVQQYNKVEYGEFRVSGGGGNYTSVLADMKTNLSCLEQAMNSDDDGNKNLSLWDKFINLLPKPLDKLPEHLGVFGQLVTAMSAITSPASIGTVGATSLSELLKNGHSITSGIYDLYKNTGDMLRLSRLSPGTAFKCGVKKFFGFEDAFKAAKLTASKAASASTRFYNNFHKQLSSKLDAFTSGGAKSVFAWAGVAVTGIANVFENIEEHKIEDWKDLSVRNVSEMVTETALDVGTTIVVSSAVAAGIKIGTAAIVTAVTGTAAVGAAPVLAVAAGTAAVIAVGDFASKKITGFISEKLTGVREEKRLTEAVSDLVLDVGECAIKGTKKIGSTIWNGITNLFSDDNTVKA